MKKFVRFVLVSALAFISFGSFSQAVKADYVHTLRASKLYATGNKYPDSIHEGWPKFDFSPVTDRLLAANTNWYSDQIASDPNLYAGYNRVATNEWVKASDVVLVFDKYVYDLDTDSDMTIFKFDPDSYAMNETDQVLPKGNWRMGQTMKYPDGYQYIQVGGNEWIKMPYNR